MVPVSSLFALLVLFELGFGHIDEALGFGKHSAQLAQRLNVRLSAHNTPPKNEHSVNLLYQPKITTARVRAIFLQDATKPQVKM